MFNEIPHSISPEKNRKTSAENKQTIHYTQEDKWHMKIVFSFFFGFFLCCFSVSKTAKCKQHKHQQWKPKKNKMQRGNNKPARNKLQHFDLGSNIKVRFKGLFCQANLIQRLHTLLIPQWK